MIKLTTVLHAADNTGGLVDLLMLLSNSEDKQIHALLEPYNELVWKQDDAPCCAILVKHESVDGSIGYSIGMSFKGVDYIIHDRDVTSQRSVEKIKTWFPHINPKHHYYTACPIDKSADDSTAFGPDYLTDIFN